MATTRSNLESMMTGAPLALLSSVAVAAGSERADSMTAIADDLVRVGLLFQRHDPSPDLFFGPEALRSQAKRQQAALPDVVTNSQPCARESRPCPRPRRPTSNAGAATWRSASLPP
jgi:hypothetical protein